MAQYIERAKVIDALINNTSIVGSELEEAVNTMCDIPAADVRPVVRGEWHIHGYSAPCSNCGFDTGFGNTLMESLIKQYKFCPNCGADMRDGTDEAISE